MSFQRNKSLPLAPPCFEYLQKENHDIKEQNEFLRDIVEVLYVQNQQLSFCLNTRKAFEQEEKFKIERLLREINKLSSNHARNYDNVKQIDKGRREHWKDFCRQKSRDHLWEYLEKVKSDIIDKQYMELISENADCEITVGMKFKDIQN